MAKTEKKTDTDGQRTVTPTFRVAFPHVFKPSGMKGTEPKYSITMLFDKKTDLSRLKLAMKHARIEKFGPDKKNWPDNLENPVKDGDEFPDYEGYAGCWAIKATSSQEYKPTVVDEDVQEILDVSKFYPGCHARAQIYARVWEFGSKMGIQFILDMVQKTGDGDRFGGRKSAESVFQPIAQKDAAGEADDNDEDDDF
jgi:hypothetical protein